MDIALNVFGIDIIVSVEYVYVMKRPDIFEESSTLKGNKRIFEDYPTVIWNSIGKPILYVTTRSSGTHIGHLVAWFDSAGNVVGWEGDSVEVRESQFKVKVTSSLYSYFDFLKFSLYEMKTSNYLPHSTLLYL